MLRTQPHAQSSQADGGSSTGMVKNKPHGYEDLSEPDMGPRDSEVNLTCSAQAADDGQYSRLLVFTARSYAQSFTLLVTTFPLQPAL